MQEGLYSVEFKTDIGSGHGVVLLKDGQLRGGDASIFYTGDYSVDGDMITAQIETGRHSDQVQSVFGVDKVNIDLRAKVTASKIIGNGKAVQAPNMNMFAELTFIR